MKKLFISLVTLVFIISVITVVSAASGSINVTASASQVIKGKTFTVAVSGTADENISGMQAAFSFDPSKLSLENKVVGAGFSDLSGTNEIAIASSGSEQAKSGTLYTFTFKVLDTAELGDTTINVTGVTMALLKDQNQENVTAENKSVTVKIVADDTIIDGGEGTTPGQQEQQGQQGQQEQQTPNAIPTSDGSESKVTPSTNSGDNSGVVKSTGDNDSGAKKLPQTGVNYTWIIAIAALSVSAIVSYVSYKKFKNI